MWFLFWAGLAVFLLSGAVVVFGRLAGVLLVRPGWITALSAGASSVAFTGSALCVCCAFVLQYTAKVRARQPEDTGVPAPEDADGPDTDRKGV
ncbi:hypothetical protein DSY14_02605 [Nocardiopsis sp. MG754419]|nr:hypothetical protein [Nocardiopsis sp. MG754419]